MNGHVRLDSLLVHWLLLAFSECFAISKCFPVYPALSDSQRSRSSWISKLYHRLICYFICFYILLLSI